MGRRSLRSLLALGACAAGLAAVPAAGTPDERPAAGETTPPRLVDEWRGRFDGVRIGHTSRGIRRRLGQPLPRGDGQITPSHIDYYEVGGPTFFASPPMLRGRNAGGALRYQEGSFFLEGGRAYGFMTVAQGARTREGVAIGDPASRVPEQYRRSRCFTANEGTEWVTFPLCEVVLRKGVRLSFGADPIKSIWLVVSSDRAYRRLARARG